MFVGPCILIYFYSKTNQMHNISNLFYFGTTPHMFRAVSPSIIRSLRLHIQQQVYVIQVLWLLAGRNEMETCNYIHYWDTGNFGNHSSHGHSCYYGKYTDTANLGNYSSHGHSCNYGKNRGTGNLGNYSSHGHSCNYGKYGDTGTPETCRVLFQNKINLRYCASGWFYYRNNLRVSSLPIFLRTPVTCSPSCPNVLHRITLSCILKTRHTFKKKIVLFIANWQLKF
jgi:hypothetical protein